MRSALTLSASVVLIAGAALAAATACSGPDESDGLLAGPKGPRNHDAGGDVSDAVAAEGGGSMGMMGQDGSMAVASDGAAVIPVEAGPALALAEKIFDGIKPKLDATCGGSTGGACHLNGGMNSPPWLMPPEYQSLKTYDMAQSGALKFIVGDPTMSRLFTKGVHLGPALDPTSDLGIGVKQWLDVEAAALKSATLPESKAFAVSDGETVNIDVGAAGMGINGATLGFDVAISGSVLSLKNMKLYAPAASGVHVLHPIFTLVTSDSDGGVAQSDDPADSFSNLDLTVPAGSVKQFGVGIALFENYIPGAKLAVEFTKIEAATGGAADSGTGGGGGCKNLSGYMAIADVFSGGQNGAANPLNCVSCHRANGSGNGALDMDSLTQNPPDYATACAQALTKVNLQNKPQSAIIQAPAGNLQHNGGKVSNAAAFTNVINSWLNGEN